MKQGKQNLGLALMIFVLLLVVTGLIIFAKKNYTNLPAKAIKPSEMTEDLAKTEQDLDFVNLDLVDSQLSQLEQY